MYQKLMTQELLKKLPPPMTQDGKGDKAIVHAHYFYPRTNWDWFVLEYDPERRVFFGLVMGLETEYGSFALDEFESLIREGYIVERDMYWEPITIGEVKKRYGR